MAQTAEEFLAHHGVQGMHWGQRKAAAAAERATQGPTKHAIAKAVVLGSYGSKSRYTNPAALKKRQTAGKLRTAAIITSLGSMSIRALGNAGGGAGAEGASALSALLATGAGGLALGSFVTGLQGIDREQQSRNK